MLIIELSFIGGRFHATPWGRNVNEGVPEWPPSPYRLARALVDTWKRRRPLWPEEKIQPILEALTGPPRFCLPAANGAHLRAFLSENEKDPTQKQLIFDAFMALDKQAKIFLGFEKELSSEAQGDLDELLVEMNYLGRSESWVKACVSKEHEALNWNCQPIRDSQSSANYNSISVACLRQHSEYQSQNFSNEATSSKNKKGKKKDENEPLSWMKALCLSSSDLLQAGWSAPPALMNVDYVLETSPGSHARSLANKTIARYRYAYYALSSKVLPLITETVSVAERIRRHLMGIHKNCVGGDPALVSPRFSGKGTDGKPAVGHKHAFFVPLDEDHDGRIDHLAVYASEPFESTEIQALDGLRSIWQPDGRPDIRLVLTTLLESPPILHAQSWFSITPMLLARHYRKGRGPYDEWLKQQIAIECKNHSIPDPSKIHFINQTLTRGHTFRWLEFQRSRKGHPPLPGLGCILTFADEVPGPFSLGAGCHFGLGLFIPTSPAEVMHLD